MPRWSVVTVPSSLPGVWLSVIKRNGRLMHSIEYTGTQRAAERDAQATMLRLAREDDKR